MTDRQYDYSLDLANNQLRAVDEALGEWEPDRSPDSAGCVGRPTMPTDRSRFGLPGWSLVEIEPVYEPNGGVNHYRWEARKLPVPFKRNKRRFR